MTALRGAAAVEEAFAHRKGLVAYLVAGHPDYDTSLAAIEAAIAGGADLIELGVPFSDPVTDGPVIQAAQDAALRAGMTLSGAIELARAIRARHTTPIVLMTYLNPILRMGAGLCMKTLRGAGIDGVIVPDMTPEESWTLLDAIVPQKLAIPFLAAPNTDPKRLVRIARLSSGFIYALGLEGVTGERASIAAGLPEWIGRVRAAAVVAGTPAKPVAVGFGISTPEQARTIARHADGVIVGSAVVRRAATGADEVGRFIRSLRDAIDQ
jgi:tryptophan synthase alpha subunit